MSTETTETVTTRTFYRGDYARFARALRKARHVQGDQYTAKPQAQQAMVTEFAQHAGMLFEAGSASFDLDKFLASTQLPVKPAGMDEHEDEAASAASAGIC